MCCCALKLTLRLNTRSGVAPSGHGVLDFVPREWPQTCCGGNCRDGATLARHREWKQPEFLDVVVREWATVCESHKGIQKKRGVDVYAAGSQHPIFG